MTWGEAIRLTRILLSDPSSQVAASLEGWPHPFSREAQIAAHAFDLAHQVAANGKSVQPYPRPWSDRSNRIGRTSLPQHKIRAALLARAPERG